ncbi:FAD assembly factor SdhE [Chelativorans sp. YIM 93263]|uniref:FAD assembly factor SdhE n=1 Tax=Chelativorans sp. YIM 93263 TaxID=2906648 RepID=UPI0023792A81|nr:succinate dehydrogenase assembly factor 2 [Chelativorans sp. YIM 93263]
MTGTSRTSADLDPRRRRVLVRAWRRGMREMDLVLGGFADAHIGTLSDADVAEFEALLEVPDPTLYPWVTGAAQVPQAYDTPLLAWIRSTAGATA